MTLTLAEDVFRRLMEQDIPLNQHLGLKLEHVDFSKHTVRTRLPIHPTYFGNAARAMPHGGIISFMIDATAGGAALISRNALNNPDSLADIDVATIDMRVDYLQAAKGDVLFASAQVMRAGRRVVMVRSDVHDASGTIVAAGSNVFSVFQTPRPA